MADTMPRFEEFFHGLWGYKPFPWQSMLAKRVAEKGGEWPQWIDLPTASGKTACIDIAVYALAAQADFPVSKRTAPRRIWFVVDRRIVVDEAYERACQIADKLRKAKNGSLLETVANRLRKLSGLAEDARPLATARLRGGVLKDDGWARIPSQPALITSTVDQLGSNLLFRSYAHGQKAAPIFAGLAANDSILFLDEAHCSNPFTQTLEAIQKFRGKKWAEEPIRNPFAFVTMSATLGNQQKTNIFPQDDDEKKKALNHDLLRKRGEVSKQAKLYKVGKTKNEDSLIKKAVELAEENLKESKLPLKIALIVNRVATAEILAKNLREKVEDRADVVLLTGRFRPYERDVLVEKWKPYLQAFDAKTPEKPILFVSTQCIEVGADFSFDLMITECASLDALRQRFGRVNRLGDGNESLVSAVLIREDDLTKKDPIYGEAKKNTWECLWNGSEEAEAENSATEDGKAKKSKQKAKQKPLVADFGICAMDKFIEEKIGDLKRKSCLAPASDAPILLPAHLDMLCQTHPVPHPAPDVDLFLHGKDRGAPEARIIWRADLNDKNRNDWQEIIAACPPTSLETLSVPLFRLQQWLKTPKVKDDFGDVEGLSPEVDEEKDKTEERQNRHFLRWRGRKKEKTKENPGTAVLEDPKEIARGDLVVVPADYGIDGLGHTFLEKDERKGVGKERLDIWEAIQKAADKAPALRLTSAIEQVKAHPQIQEFLEWIKSEEPSDKEIGERIKELKDWQPAEEESPLPKHVQCFLEKNEIQKMKIEKYPVDEKGRVCGIILFGKVASSDKEEDDLFADEDDLTSASPSSVALENHLSRVAGIAEKLAEHCLPEGFSPALFKTAGQWHDVGKLDERFQILLRNGDDLADFGKLLAKSDKIPGSPQRRSEVWKSAGLPEHFRHEMLSLQLAEAESERFAQFSEEERDLILHLIASHHGYARPFAPVCEDENPPPVSGTVNGCNCKLDEKERRGLIPPHRLDSGVSERFWRLTRRYGWWGLAYLESVLRLADWRASRPHKKPHE